MVAASGSDENGKGFCRRWCSSAKPFDAIDHCRRRHQGSVSVAMCKKPKLQDSSAARCVISRPRPWFARDACSAPSTIPTNYPDEYWISFKRSAPRRDCRHPRRARHARRCSGPRPATRRPRPVIGHQTVGPASQAAIPGCCRRRSPDIRHQTLSDRRRASALGHFLVPTAGIEKVAPEPGSACMRHTADTSFLGLSAARLAGSGVGIWHSGEGHGGDFHEDCLPHNNLSCSTCTHHDPRSLPAHGRTRPPMHKASCPSRSSC